MADQQTATQRLEAALARQLQVRKAAQEAARAGYEQAPATGQAKRP